MAVSARMSSIIRKVDAAHQSFLDDLRAKAVAARLRAAELKKAHVARSRRLVGPLA